MPGILLIDSKISKIVTAWQKERAEEDLDPKIVKKEMKKLKLKLDWYNVPMVGAIPEERPDGCMIIMYNQLYSCSGKEIRTIKLGEVKQSKDTMSSLHCSVS